MTELLAGEEPATELPDADGLPSDLLARGYTLHRWPEGTRYPVRDEKRRSVWVYIATGRTTYTGVSAHGQTPRCDRIDEVIEACYAIEQFQEWIHRQRHGERPRDA